MVATPLKLRLTATPFRNVLRELLQVTGPFVQSHVCASGRCLWLQPWRRSCSTQRGLCTSPKLCTILPVSTGCVIDGIESSYISFRVMTNSQLSWFSGRIRCDEVVIVTVMEHSLVAWSSILVFRQSITNANTRFGYQIKNFNWNKRFTIRK